ncbi:MAG: type II toxin-antitoxin system RelE/ParE family toxin [Acidobacteriaceae bacterium]
MIVSFRDKQSAQFDEGKRVKAFAGFERAARLKLDRLEAAGALSDLSALPGNGFEMLKGKRHGQYSIRINDQWRICFTWAKGEPGPSDVEMSITTRGEKRWHCLRYTPGNSFRRNSKRCA